MITVIKEKTKLTSENIKKGDQIIRSLDHVGVPNT